MSAAGPQAAARQIPQLEGKGRLPRSGVEALQYGAPVDRSLSGRQVFVFDAAIVVDVKMTGPAEDPVEERALRRVILRHAARPVGRAVDVQMAEVDAEAETAGGRCVAHGLELFERLGHMGCVLEQELSRETFHLTEKSIQAVHEEPRVGRGRVVMAHVDHEVGRSEGRRQGEQIFRRCQGSRAAVGIPVAESISLSGDQLLERHVEGRVKGGDLHALFVDGADDALRAPEIVKGEVLGRGEEFDRPESRIGHSREDLLVESREGKEMRRQCWYKNHRRYYSVIGPPSQKMFATAGL